MLFQRFAFNTFDELKHGTKVRMAHLQRAAGMLAANPHRNMTVAANPTWRTVRYRKLSEKYPRACPGFNGNRPVLSCFDESSLPVRSVQFADEMKDVYRIDHRGWFADSDGHGDQGVIRGIVAFLPHGRMLAGYHWSYNGAYVLFTDEVFTDAGDAVISADHEAKKYAELCREDDEKCKRMGRAETAVEDTAEELRDAWALRRMGRRDSDDVRELVERLREAREELRAAVAAYEGGLGL